MRKLGEWNIERINQLTEDRTLDRWLALMTAPAKEVDAGLILDKLGVRVWAPTVKRVRRIKASRCRYGVVHTSHARLPRYIFVAIEDEVELVRSLYRTTYIRFVLGFGGRPHEITRKELDKIDATDVNQVVKGKPPARPRKRLDVDKPVRVDKGILRGHYCTIEKIEGRELEVFTEMLGSRAYQRISIDHVTQHL